MTPAKAQRELKLLNCHARPPRTMAGIPRARLSDDAATKGKRVPTWLEGAASLLRRIGSRLMKVGRT